MGSPLPRPAALVAKLETPVEEWHYLDEDVLRKTRSRKVCMTCHWFRHHAGVNYFTREPAARKSPCRRRTVHCHLAGAESLI
jgi:hypothetical protein